MIQINKFPEEYVELYSPSGNFLGKLTKLQLYDIQFQICQNNSSGYYIN